MSRIRLPPRPSPDQAATAHAAPPPAKSRNRPTAKTEPTACSSHHRHGQPLRHVVMIAGGVHFPRIRLRLLAVARGSDPKLGGAARQRTGSKAECSECKTAQFAVEQCTLPTVAAVE